MTKFFCKMISFKEKMKVSDLQDLFFGKLNAVDWKINVKHMKKCMYFLFQALGGFQCRHHELRSHEEGKPDIERTEAWNVGFDFIEEYGPRENVKNRQLRWITIQISTSSSPIYKWPAVLVEKSLRNLSNDGVLAQLHENWPLTLFDLDNRFLKVLAPLVPSGRQSAWISWSSRSWKDACCKDYCHGNISNVVEEDGQG